MADMEAISVALQAGKRDDVKEMVAAALAEGVPPGDLLADGLIAGMAVIGEKFKRNEVYVPEVLIAARAMKGAMEVLKPKLVEAGVEPIGKVVIGTVKGDLHDIGKNLVMMMLQGGGFEVIDAGIDVEPAQFIEHIKESGAKLVGLSALLTTTMPQMKNVIDGLKEAGLEGVKVMVGGAPVTQSYADEIGADGYAPDAASGVDLAKGLLGG